MVKKLRKMKNSAAMIRCFLQKILLEVNREVDRWQCYACDHMTGLLQEQALASIANKKFHCQGGGFYALYPGINAQEFVPFIVALQTISDYLDNLCDRASVTEETAFRQLHLAITDALDPTAEHKDYYAQYPYREDGGYLDQLVHTCQDVLRPLPGYPAIRHDLLRLGTLYSELQTYKHIDVSLREQAMLDWLHVVNTTELSHWEFAAATGSTLGMFMLAAAACQPGLTSLDAKKITAAYFPWICGLHIQMDYFVDQAEDRLGGDLNFISYYKDDAETARRLGLFYHRAFVSASRTPHPYFAETIVQGLVALYLSDPKINTTKEKNLRKVILSSAGIYTTMLYGFCKLLRRKHIL